MLLEPVLIYCFSEHYHIFFLSVKKESKQERKKEKETIERNEARVVVNLCLWCSLILIMCAILIVFTRLYCPFDISRKDVFCLAFYLKWKYFVLIDHILSETICLFCFCDLFSDMYPKIKFIAENWSDLCNFHSKVIFWNFCSRKYFFTFLLLNLNYWCFTTIL